MPDKRNVIIIILLIFIFCALFLDDKKTDKYNSVIKEKNEQIEILKRQNEAINNTIDSIQKEYKKLETKKSQVKERIKYINKVRHEENNNIRNYNAFKLDSILTNYRDF